MLKTVASLGLNVQNVQPVSSQSDTGLLASGQPSVGLTETPGCANDAGYMI